MSGWMKRDGVLSSFHFNMFSDSLQIRSPYAPPFKPLKFQRFFKFLKWLDLVGCDWIFAPTHDTPKALKNQCFEGVCSLALVG
jgi:hypothetical protein